MPSPIIFTFNHNGINRFLSSVANIGTDNRPDLKFCLSRNANIINLDNSNKIEEDSVIWENCELTYHFDGSFLRKLPNFPIKDKIYKNPYGDGTRITPLNQISDFEPIAFVEIKDCKLCKKYTHRKKNPFIVHNCDNQYLFDGDSFQMLLYIKNKDFKVNKYTTPFFYSYTVEGISNTLDVGIFIQKKEFEAPKKEYSKIWKKEYYPAIMNSISPCCRESKNYFKEVFSLNIFNEEMYDRLTSVNNNKMIFIDKKGYQEILIICDLIDSLKTFTTEK